MPDASEPDDAAAPVTPDDHDLAARLAKEAGELLVELRARMHADGRAPAEWKTEGDRRAHELLIERLSAARPDDAILSEESREGVVRLGAARTWIVDPLDGTREFSEWPRDDWAVHVALVVGDEPVCGAVALPARGLVCSTASPPAPPEHPAAVPRVAVSRTRMPEPVLRLAERLGAEQVPLGSAGVKTMAVVLGDADVYAHDGGQYEWDSCAPVAVAKAAGLHCSRLDGSPLRYNNPDPLLPDLVVCHPELADRCLDLLAEIRGS
jgi:3'(2'), 5'-bisphosphate nucleotidase